MNVYVIRGLFEDEKGPYVLVDMVDTEAGVVTESLMFDPHEPIGNVVCLIDERYGLEPYICQDCIDEVHAEAEHILDQ